jgi:serine/threonine protein kinase
MNKVAPEGSADEHSSDLDFLQPSTRPDSLGRLGHYEMLQMLGRGEFGIVFRAFDEQLRRVVAIKVLAPQLAATSGARIRFLREGRSSAKVRHENVVQVYAAMEQSLPYLVMELVAGETLQQRLDRTGRLEPAEVVQIGRQIAEGLAAAHAMGLIHRDIKPANILIEAGPDQRVKITDFGLARAADDASLTQSGVICGTPMYMAPEQAQSEALDPRADLFSLGSVLYMMCSGQPPFQAGSTLAVLKRVVEDTPRPIPEIVPDVPPWLCEIITQLHAKKPEGRIGTAREVADRLERGVTGMRRPRHRIRRWAAAAVLLLLLGGLGATEATGVTNVRGTVIDLFSPKETPVVEADDAGSGVKIDGPAKEEPALKKTAIKKPPEPKDNRAQTPIRDPDRRAAEYVLSLHGKVQINEQDREIEAAADLPRRAFRLTWVNLGGSSWLGSRQVRDAGLTYLAHCDHLTYLNLDEAPLDDAGLTRLKGCKKLTYLNLGHTWVTDVGLANLRDCKDLGHLNLDRTAVGDAGLVYIKDAQKLLVLELRATQVTDAGLVHLKRCTSLTELSLQGSPVGDAGLAHLKDCKKLQRLDLANTLQNTRVSDAGLAYVKDLESLQSLALAGNEGVTDAGLARLKDCKNLTELAVKKTKVTALGIDELRKNLPRCKIEWDGGVIEPR